MHFHTNASQCENTKTKNTNSEKSTQKTHNIINTNIRMSRLYISHCILVAIDILSDNIFTNYV